MKLLSLAVFAALAATPALARDSAPPPTKPVGVTFFSGRWYEIARTENLRQRGCEGTTYEFGTPKGELRPFVLTCRRGSPAAKPESMAVSVRVPTDPLRNRFRVQAMGGALKQEYWVLDRAEDLSWAIMGTPGGNYVWLLSRSPKMDASLKTQLMSRIRAMGYDLGKIVQPRHG